MGIEIDEEIRIIKERLSLLENVDNRNFKLDERAAKDDIITRSYRVHQSAIDMFNKLISKDEFKIYTVQDLVSQAFWEFCEKYNNL